MIEATGHTGHPPAELVENGSISKARLAKMRTAVIVLGSDDHSLFADAMDLIRWIDAATATYKFVIVSPAPPGRAKAVNILEERVPQDVADELLARIGADLFWRSTRKEAPPLVQRAMRQRNAYLLIGFPGSASGADAASPDEIRRQVGGEFLSKGSSHQILTQSRSSFFRRQKIAWRERHWRRAQRQS